MHVPDNTLKETVNSKERYLQIGCALKLAKEQIVKGDYTDLGLRINDENLEISNTIIPPGSNGRYSRYNLYGRSIIRKDLPKIPKWFYQDVYPYGNTSRSTVSVSYSRDVWQREEWMPEFLSLSISLKKEDDDCCYFIIKCDEILDKNSKDFEYRLLYNINLVSENCGDYQIMKSDSDDIFNTLHVGWELLPPGHFDIDRVITDKEKLTSHQQEVLFERYEFLKGLKPKTWIKGTNKFTQYFGAIMENDVVVLENTHSGNAVYVFYQNWESLSKLSRTELIRMNSSDVKRIRHVGNWKELLEKNITNKV